MDARAKRTEITQDRVLKELAHVAFSDVRATFDEAGQLRSPTDLDDDTAAAIASVEVVERRGIDVDGRPTITYVHKMRLVEKTPSLALLCRHLGIPNDKLDLTARRASDYKTAPDAVLIRRVEELLLKAKADNAIDVSRTEGALTRAAMADSKCSVRLH